MHTCILQMDKFLTGFGMSKLSVGGGNKSETSRSGSPASLSGVQNGTPETQVKPTKVRFLNCPFHV